MENGTVRSKNSRNILTKNLFDLCIGGFIYWLIGFGIAYGGEVGGFFGTNKNYYASSGFDFIKANEYTNWIF